MIEETEKPMETCKQNSDRNLCVFIRTTKTYHKLAKEQEYYTGPK
ncbi:hypothetical protein [Methanococcoides sp. LMO-2]|uniref:Uncharacterized protein n=1 Tax=Methanococcoides cohabitans TaxID=3136559 RepID=A0ABU9KW22_9EURY